MLAPKNGSKWAQNEHKVFQNCKATENKVDYSQASSSVRLGKNGKNEVKLIGKDDCRIGNGGDSSNRIWKKNQKNALD